jgi:uncharacterized protein YjbI with pentapeptide repeats
MADKLDPYDVTALGGAVNDSATRVSAIWITFLIFSLYMLVAAGTVTQRQLFLDEPTKLPILNIDLPLWWFFLLAPTLFVIFHVYVLLQVMLLGRTTAAYNTAVVRCELSIDENIALRQRLANTIFAQIFAGSPREREGFVGALLRMMVWITLAAAPILIVIAFQFQFLPYHSHIVTWTHRFLILVELAAFFLIWPLALDPQRDFQWPKVRASLKRLAAIPRQLLGPKDERRAGLLWLRKQSAPLSACVLFILVPLSLATFPGEPHVNIFTGQSPSSVHCDRWFTRRFDRLFLPLIDVIDDEKLAKIMRATSERNLPSYRGKRTWAFRDRDFNCSNLSLADLRDVDLVGAQLYQADLGGTALDGAVLDGAQLQGAKLDQAELKGASLNGAMLQKASFDGARLQGAGLSFARLEGASLDGAQLQGASLISAELQGATLVGAQLQGAILFGAQLQGTILDSARLQGVDLTLTNFQGASLKHTQLQGAQFLATNLDHSVLSDDWIWHAADANCTKARVTNPKPDNVVDISGAFGEIREQIPAAPDAIRSFVGHSVAEIPDASARKEVAGRMQGALAADSEKDFTALVANAWSACAEVAAKTSQSTFNKEHVALLRKLACDAPENREAIASGIIRNWIAGARGFFRLEISFGANDRPSAAVSTQLARSLLGQDGRTCAARDTFDEPTMKKLREAAENAASEPPENPTSPPSGFLPPESPDATLPGIMPSPRPAAPSATPPQ